MVPPSVYVWSYLQEWGHVLKCVVATGALSLICDQASSDCKFYLYEGYLDAMLRDLRICHYHLYRSETPVK